MDPKTLENLVSLAKESAGAKNKVDVLTPPKEPAHVYFTVDPEGNLTERTAARAPRSAKINRVADLPTYVAWAVESLNASPTLWIDAYEGVRVVLEDTTEFNVLGTLVCPLIATEEWNCVVALGDEQARPRQKTLLKALRTKLADAIEDAAAVQLIKALKTLDFKTSTASRSTVEHGRESLGREFEARIVADAGGLPDKIELNLRRFTDPFLAGRKTVRFAVDQDPSDQTFALIPIGEDLADAETEALKRVEEFLASSLATSGPEGKPIPIFFGTP